jgi:NADH-quinone oxidoreductase subunit N
MFTNDAIANLKDNLWIDLRAFAPELVLCIGIIVMLGIRLFPRLRTHMSGLALFFSGGALFLCVGQWLEVTGLFARLNLIGDLVHPQPSYFSGMLQLDHFTSFMRMVLLAFVAMLTLLSMLTGIPDEEDSADFCTLLLGGTLGMMLMVSATHLLMVFIAIEMASLPSYALAGFLKGRRLSSEAALKYVVYGGGASGVMLYGISLIAGRFGTGYIPDVAAAIQQQMQNGPKTLVGLETVVLLGLVFILVGLAFKLSVVPFHFWAPDVFEGAAAEVGAFLSVASKAAALGLTARLLIMITSDGSHRPIESIQRTIGPAIAFFAALTATFGNLAAFPQTNLKRLLAYSTIAHAGYMLMGLAALSVAGVSAVLYYLVAYLVMNLGAFAVIAYIRNKTGSEDLRDLRGLIYRSPLAVALLCVFLLSLLGLPPLAGFAAKFGIFQVLFDAGKEYTAEARNSDYSLTMGYSMYALLAIGGINTVISAVYYLKVMKVMILERSVEDIEGIPAARSRPTILDSIRGSLAGNEAADANLAFTFKSLLAGTGGVILALLIFVIFVAWGPISSSAELAMRDLQPPQKVTIPYDPATAFGAGPGVIGAGVPAGGAPANAPPGVGGRGAGGRPGGGGRGGGGGGRPGGGPNR